MFQLTFKSSDSSEQLVIFVLKAGRVSLLFTERSLKLNAAVGLL